MSWPQKIIFQPLALLLCCLTYVLVLLQLVSWQFIDHDRVRRELISKASQFFSVPLTLSSLNFSLFPRPNLQIEDLDIPFSANCTLQLKTARIAYAWEHLLQGKPPIHELWLKEPVLTLRIAANSPPALTSLSGLQPLLEKLSAIETTRVDNAHLVVVSGRQKRLSLSNVNFQAKALPLLTLEFEGQSNLSGPFRIHLSGEPATPEFQGGLTIEKLKLHSLSNFLPREMGNPGQALLNITSEIKMGPGNILESDFEVKALDWRLQRSGQAWLFKDPSLSGRLHLSPERILLQVAELRFTDPEMQLKGKLDWIFSPRQIDLSLEGSNLEIASLKKICLSLCDHHVLNTIVDIVPKGRIPHLAMHVSGASGPDFGRSLRLQASLEQGTVIVPDPGFHLSQVSGQVEYKSGILHCSQVRARYKQAQARQGELLLGLNSQKDVFSLRTEIESDLQALPIVLKETISSEEFLRQLESFKSVSGQGSGTLRIDRDPNGLQVEVNLKQGFLQTRHDALPFALKIGPTHLQWSPAETSVQTQQLDLGSSSFQSVTAIFQEGPKTFFDLVAKNSRIELQQVLPWMQSLSDLSSLLPGIGQTAPGLQSTRLAAQGRLLGTHLRLHGDPAKPRDWKIHFEGAVQDLVLQHEALPAPLRITKGSLQAGDSSLTLKNGGVECLDGFSTVSMTRHHVQNQKPVLDFTFQGGRLGPKILSRLQNTLSFPEGMAFKDSLEIRQGSLKLDQGQFTRLEVGLAADDTTLNLDFKHEANQVYQSSLEILDAFSKVRVELSRDSNSSFAARFSGFLAQATFQKLFQEQTYFLGKALGHFSMSFGLNPFKIEQAVGKLRLTDAYLPIPGAANRLGIEQLSLKANQKHIAIEEGKMMAGSSPVQVSGKIFLLAHSNVLDLKIRTQTLHWDDNLFFVFPGKSEKTQSTGWSGSLFKNLRGTLSLQADSLEYGPLTWQPFLASLHLDDRQQEVSIDPESRLCSIRTPGRIELKAKTIQLRFQPEAEIQDLTAALSCLLQEAPQLSGLFSLEGVLNAQGTEAEAIKRSFQGHLQLRAENGRIQKATILAKVLQILNSSEILFGTLPALDKQGLAYRSLHLDCRIENSIAYIQEGYLNGHSMNIEFMGHIDLLSQDLELVLAVAPLKTVDRILDKLPVIKSLTGRHLVSIPLKVSGTLQEQRITPMAPDQLGENFLALIMNTLKLPVTIIQPLQDSQENLRPLVLEPRQEQEGR